MLYHCVKNIRKSSINNVVFFPYKCTCFCSVVVCFIIFFFVTAQRCNVICKMCQNNVRIVNFLIPRSANKTIIVERRKSIYNFINRQFTFADKNGFSVFHIAQTHIFNICPQVFNSCFAAFTGAEIGAADIPRSPNCR